MGEQNYTALVKSSSNCCGGHPAASSSDMRPLGESVFAASLYVESLSSHVGLNVYKASGAWRRRAEPQQQKQLERKRGPKARAQAGPSAAIRVVFLQGEILCQFKNTNSTTTNSALMRKMQI